MDDAFDRVGDSRWPFWLIGLAALLLAWGSYWGVFVAPPERHMGEVYRILYIHVPMAWNAMLAFTFAFVCALASLLSGSFRWDARLEAAELFPDARAGEAALAGLWLRWGDWAKARAAPRSPRRSAARWCGRGPRGCPAPRSESARGAWPAGA